MGCSVWPEFPFISLNSKTNQKNEDLCSFLRYQKNKYQKLYFIFSVNTSNKLFYNWAVHLTSEGTICNRNIAIDIYE